MTSIIYMIKCVFILTIFWFVSLGVISFLPESKRPNNADEGYSLVSQRTGDAGELVKRMDVVLNEVNDLKKNYGDIRRMLSGGTASKLSSEVLSDSSASGSTLSFNDPSPLYEKTRRLLEIDLKELWYNVRAKTGNIADGDMAQIREVYK